MICQRAALLGLGLAIVAVGVPTAAAADFDAGAGDGGALGTAVVDAAESGPPQPAAAAEPTGGSPADPFGWGDFRWLNGGSRQASRLLSWPAFTAELNFDINATASNHRPVDDTVVGSTALARNEEVQLSFIGLGGDLHYRAARGRVMLQLGTRSTVVPRNDPSVERGQFDLRSAYRHLSEAYAGLHWDKLQGINLDLGLFSSYVGLFSYGNFDNWAYQPSFTSDNTPWFFNGLRLQAFVTQHLKVEGWLINGWQSYAKFNRLPALGAQLMWRPTQSLAAVINGYVGTDTPLKAGRLRAHLDQSIQWRYRRRPASLWRQAAVSLTLDVGGESGDGATIFTQLATRQRFVSAMAYHRSWFCRDQLAWTVGGGFMHNPGRYLVLAPPAAAAQLPVAPGLPFDAWDASTSFDYMPNDYLTCRVELVHRRASVPYFAGPGGVTSKSGFSPAVDGAKADASWQPQLMRGETRLILALMARF